MSQARGAQDGTTFCGARTYVFSDPGLIQDNGGGTWSIQASSGSGYSESLTPVTITITVTVAHADTTIVTRSDFTLDITIKHLCESTTISTGTLLDMEVLVGSGNAYTQ